VTAYRAVPNRRRQERSLECAVGSGVRQRGRAPAARSRGERRNAAGEWPQKRHHNAKKEDRPSLNSGHYILSPFVPLLCFFFRGYLEVLL